MLCDYVDKDRKITSATHRVESNIQTYQTFLLSSTKRVFLEFLRVYEQYRSKE
jgi:hypothetical protein